MKARVTVTVELIEEDPRRVETPVRVTVTREQLVSIIPASRHATEAAAHYAAGLAAGDAINGALATRSTEESP